MQRIFYSINIKTEFLSELIFQGQKGCTKIVCTLIPSTSGSLCINQNLLYAMVARWWNIDWIVKTVWVDPEGLVRLVKWWSAHPDTGFLTVKKEVHKLNVNEQGTMKERTAHNLCISKTVVSSLREVIMIIPFCLAFGLDYCGLFGASPVQERYRYIGERSLEDNWKE